MRSRPFVLLALVAPALLSACGAIASLEQPGTEQQRLAQVHAGLEKQEVRHLAGTPDLVTSRAEDGAELWVYRDENNWEHRAEIDIAFDPSGHVSKVMTVGED